MFTFWMHLYDMINRACVEKKKNISDSNVLFGRAWAGVGAEYVSISIQSKVIIAPQAVV